MPRQPVCPYRDSAALLFDGRVRRALFLLCATLLAGGPVSAVAQTAVGRIEASLEVTPLGSARYEIPIAVATGANGLRPDIALLYDSHAGDGLAGIGWKLSGLSVITRCGKTIAADGERRGVRYDAHDRYCLDGVPLRLVSGSYGATGAEYRTEIHRQQRIISYNSQGIGPAGGPAWFQVEHPDGLIYRYGHNADSRIEAAGRSDQAVTAWALDEVRDRFGAKMSFSYTEDAIGGEYLPREIHWTMLGTQTQGAARYRLLFEYEDRPAEEVRSGHRWGARHTRARRLQRIRYQFRAGSSFDTVQEYTLTYAAPEQSGSTRRSRLASIRQCGPTQCLPPTTLQWLDGTAGWTAETAGPAGIDADRITFGDFNGDGARDALAAVNGYWQVLLANPATGQFLAPLHTGIADHGGSLLPLEANGSGLTDLLIQTAPGAATWRLYTSAGNGSLTPGPEYSFNATAQGITALDTDGDGLDELVYFTGAGPSLQLVLHRNHGDGFSPPLHTQINAASLSAAGLPDQMPHPAPLETGRRPDFDGDGRQDLLLRFQSLTPGTPGWAFLGFLSTGDDFETVPEIGTYGTNAALVADVNGDGLSDLVVHQINSGRWQTILSQAGGRTGGTFPYSTPICGTEAAISDSWEQARIVDYDGDGRADLLLADGTGWRVHRSDGSCFEANTRAHRLSGGTAPAQTALVVAGDLTGNGLGDLLLVGRDGRLRMRRHQGTVGDLLLQLNDGLGNLAVLVHESLAGSSRYHHDPEPAPPGERLLRGGPLQVVTGVYRSDGAGSYYGTGYRYWNARWSTHGRGLLGFARIRTTDERNGSCSDAEYLQAFPFVGRLARRVDWQSTAQCHTGNDLAGLPMAAEYSASWQQEPPGTTPTLPRFVYLDADTTRIYEVDARGGQHGQLSEVVSRRLQHDFTHAAVIEETVERSSPQWPGAVWRTITSRTLNHALRDTWWCLGAPEQVAITREKPGGERATRVTRYGYDANSRCWPRTETVGPPEQPARQLRTTWTRHSSGRLTSIVLDAANGAGERRQTSFSWDSYGFRPAALTLLIAGQPDPVLRWTWNHAFGLPASQTDERGHTLSWEYDDFGRVRQQSGPGAAAITSERIACQTGGCWVDGGLPRYRIRNTHADGFWTETVHDGRDRAIGEAVPLHDGAESRRQIRYDAFDRIARESQPYLVGEAVYWTRHAYDLRGRRTETEQPLREGSAGGRITRSVYSRLSVTLEDPGQRSTTYVHDPEHRLWMVQAPLGSTAVYDYTPFGELSDIVDDALNHARFEYDARGRPVMLHHPDSGVWRYDWNVYGELVRQEDDRTPASVISWDYDQLGRLRRRSEPEGVTTWTYQQSAGPGFGLLQSVSGPTDQSAAGYSQTRLYDSLSRPREVTTRIDDRSYRMNSSWDAFGRLTALIYPEAAFGMRPEFAYSYTATGHLDAIRQSFAGFGFTVYQVGQSDALGRITRAEFGRGALTAERSYDRANLLPLAIVSRRADGSPLQDYRYSWDQAGNLVARSDLQRDLTESFVHDELDRLRTVTLNGQTTLSLSYAANGNLLAKSDVGNYSYLPGRPRAVAGISGGPAGTQSFGYDANGNMVSRNGGAIHWTSYNLPREINLSGDGCASQCSRFIYGPDRSRIRQQVRRAGTVTEIDYVSPLFEAEYLPDGNARYTLRVQAGGETVLMQRMDTQNGWESWFVLGDHLVSVDRLTRDFGTDPSEVHAYSYDAFGRRRGADWRPAAGALPELRGRRGYTGHEHLEHLGLIHMNGRIQDPLLGRMLSPDPLLGVPQQPQSLNPYSYVWNSPLRLLDPGGLEATDLRNFRPDPVHFQHSSMADRFGRAAEHWVAAWGGLAAGGGTGYLLSRVYAAYLTIDPTYRQLAINTAIEIAQGAVVASLPLDQEPPPVAPLPEPRGIERPDERTRVEQHPVPGGSASGSSIGSLFDSGAAAGPLLLPVNGSLPGLAPGWLPWATPPRIYLQYSWGDTSGNLVIRSVPEDSGPCRSCHAPASPGAGRAPRGPQAEESSARPAGVRPAISSRESSSPAS